MKYTITYQENNKLKKKKCILNVEENPFEKVDNIIAIKDEGIRQKKFFIGLRQIDTLQLFQQISLMLDSGLSFIEAIDILQDKNQNPIIEKVLKNLKTAVIKSIPLKNLLAPYEKYIGKTSIIFLKLGLENGNIKESIASLVEVLQEDIEIKKQLLGSLRYPFLLVISLSIALGMVFLYVLPNFEFVFQNLETLPIATKVLLFLEKIITQYYVVAIFLMCILFLSGYIIYQKYRMLFEKFFILYLPLIRTILKSYYFYKLFLGMSIIIRSKYQFQIAIKSSITIIDNRYLQQLLEKILEDIKNGNSIVSSFQKYKIFDEVSIKLLSTAENTSRYDIVLDDLANYYKLDFQNKIKTFEALFEPLMILIIASVVLWLVLAIMVPIWDMGSLAL